MTTYAELIAQRDELARQQRALDELIAGEVKEQRAGAIQQAKALMADFGITVADLADGKPGRNAKAAADGHRSTVAAKYRDPVTGATWSGRGLKPRWLSAALAGGKALADFAIQA